MPVTSLKQASTITLSGPHLNNKAPLGIIVNNSKPLLVVNQSAFTIGVYCVHSEIVAESIRI